MTAYKILGISSAIATADQEQQQHENQAQVPITPPSPVTPVQSPPSLAIPMAPRDSVQWSNANNFKNCPCGLFADTRIHDDYILDHDDLDGLDDLEDDDDDNMSIINENDNDQRTWSLDSQEGEDVVPLSDDDELDYEDGAVHGGQEQEEDDEDPHHQGHQLEQETLLLDSWTFGR